MIAATILAVFFVPVFFVVIQRISEFKRRRPAPAAVTEDVAEVSTAEVAAG